MRYEHHLTEKGLDPYPVVLVIVHWRNIRMSDCKGRLVLHRHTIRGHEFDPVMTCSECHKEFSPRAMMVHPGHGVRDEIHLPKAERKSTVAEGHGSREEHVRSIEVVVVACLARIDVGQAQKNSLIKCSNGRLRDETLEPIAPDPLRKGAYVPLKYGYR